MRILYIGYTIIDYDGRTKELIKIFEKIGEVDKFVLTVNKENRTDKIMLIRKKELLNIFNYLKYILRLRKCVFKKYDVIISDNFFSSIPALLFTLFQRRALLIQDVRELYFPSQMKGLKNKILVFFESILMKKSDIVISANRFRSRIMKKIYDLKEEPLSFENIRALPNYNQSKSFNTLEFDFLKGIEASHSFNLISTGGYFLSRGTLSLVQSVGELGEEFKLIIVGGGTTEEKEILLDTIRKGNFKNIILLEKVFPHELSKLIEFSHAGVVHYHQNDLNNRYCASGKIYEFLFLETPVICTTNIPLKNFINEYKVGVYNKDFKKSIVEMKVNYNKYKQRAIMFSEAHSPIDNNKYFSGILNKKILIKLKK